MPGARAFFALCVVLGLSGCLSTGGIPREPFADIPVPSAFIPYSDHWTFIQTPSATAARLVYMTELGPDAALAALRAGLVASGWTPREPAGFVNPQGFKGLSQEFVKGGDICRVTVIEGAYSVHVELAVARLNPK